MSIFIVFLFLFLRFTCVESNDIKHDEVIYGPFFTKNASEKPYLTIFSTLKPSIDLSVRKRQRNAVFSWKSMIPSPEIILFGDEEGTSEIANDFGTLYVPFIERSEEFSPMPLVNKLFQQAKLISTSQILMYTNADIIFAKEELINLCLLAKKQFENFLIVGRRIDIEVTESIERLSNWEEILFSKYEQKRLFWESNSNDNRWAIDFFIFTKDFWNNIEIPPFLLGVPAFDNWLLHEPNRKGLIVIDATKTLRVIHQNHEFTHGSERKKKMKTYNEKLAGRWFLGNTDKATYFTEFCGEEKNTCFKKRL